MARLPSERYLMQQVDSQVILFEDCSEREVVRFEAGDGIAVQNALDAILVSELGEEDKCFACFWAGYFHAFSAPVPAMPAPVYVHARDREVWFTDAGTEIARYPAADGEATAMAQKAIHDSGLFPQEKSLAHFWAGFFWARS
jgi:hypothetical protein